MFVKRRRFSAGDFQLWKPEKTVRTRLFVVKLARANAGVGRCAVVVSTRIDKRATRRNMIRRGAYDALRDVLSTKTDAILIAQPQAKNSSRKEIIEDIHLLLRKG